MKVPAAHSSIWGQLCTVLTGVAMMAPWLGPAPFGPSSSIPSTLLTLAALAYVLVCWHSMPMAIVPLAWLLAALLSSLIALCQYFNVEQYFSLLMSVSPDGEAYANLRQRNQFATLTSIGLAALLWWAAQAHGVHAGRWRTWAGGLTAVLLGLGNAVSSSRTGLVQLVLLAALAAGWGLWRQQPQRKLLVIALLTYGMAAFLLPNLAGSVPGYSGILSRFQQDGPTCASRLTLWRNMFELISQRPWLGWGWGELDYAHFMTVYDRPRYCELLDNAHNLPLHLAVELGLPLALLICGVVVCLIWRAKPWREKDPTRQVAWMVLAVISLHSMLEYPLWYGPFQMAFGLSLALLWPKRQTAARVTSSCVSGWRHVAALLLWVGTACAAWDYYRVSQIYLPMEQRSPAYRDNTLEKISGSWLFREQVLFADFFLTTLTRENAAELNEMGHKLLHFSPEPRVVEKLIESAMLLEHVDEARFYMERYRAAYPSAYARWQKEGLSAVK